MPYWFTESLLSLPALMWVYLGVGLPWALVVLPRKDWPQHAVVACLTLAVGPALLTGWMLVLGMAEQLTLAAVLIGSIVMAFMGWALTFRKLRRGTPLTSALQPFDAVEKLLIALIVIAGAVQLTGIMYWPFTAYDTLWVYGYQGRLYTLLGQIPASIGYYPQYLPLQYAYAQLAVGGANDHAARMVIPFINAGAVLATYTLGLKLFNRRTGITAAALWALYPHVGEWSRYGDLEILTAFLFTGAAAFFLLAWLGEQPRRRYALTAGLLLGIGLWTKPTVGAFVWGVGLLCIVELVRVRFDVQAAWPRVQVALLTGFAAAPLGGVWYIRNILLGHEAVTFPPSFWLTLAARSGDEFGWPLLSLILLLAYLHFGPHTHRPDKRFTLGGLALIVVGLLPSILNPHRMDTLEWVICGVGLVVLGRALVIYWRALEAAESRQTTARLGWTIGLVLPYFVTWFYSYSYHYRLSFAIVPLMLLPTAVILARWVPPQIITHWTPVRRRLALAVLVMMAIPGILSALYDLNAGWDWLWSDEMPDDYTRYQSGNYALMDVVQGIQIYLDEGRQPPLKVVAPNVQTLPFFFPLEDISLAAPTRLDDIQDAVYFINSHPQGTGVYDGIPLAENQVLSALTRGDILRRAWGKDDGIFRYDIYELHLENRFIEPRPNAPQTGEVVFGDVARFIGHDIGGSLFWPGRRVVLKLMWEVLAPIPEDYTIFIHLSDESSGGETVWHAWDGKPNQTYLTTLWQPGEYVIDERVLEVPIPDVPVGEGYTLRIGMYNLVTGERVPVTIDGVPAGDGVTLGEHVVLVAEEPS